MKAIYFKDSNLTLRGCSKDIQDLRVFKGSGRIISKWKLNLWDRIKVLFTGTVWFSMFDISVFPPIKLSTEYPFVK